MCISNYPLEIFYVLKVAVIAMVITKPDHVPFASLIYAIYAQGVYIIYLGQIHKFVDSYSCIIKYSQERFYLSL